MTIGTLYAVAKALNVNEKKTWKEKILISMGMEPEALPDLPVEVLVVAAYACFDHNFYVPGLKVVGYGAGKMAQRYIPQICGLLEFYEIWDAYSNKKEVATIPVVRPEVHKLNMAVPLVIFIDDLNTRFEVLSSYRKKGYQNLFHFRDYIAILDHRYAFDMLKAHATDATKKLIEQFYSQYERIEDICTPVLFSFLKKELREKQIPVIKAPYQEEILEDRLADQLTVDRMPEGVLRDSVHAFLLESLNNLFDLACNLEKLLEQVLNGHVKTLERPMKMADDWPYDEFAVTTVVNEVMSVLFADCADALDAVQSLRMIAESSVPLMASESTFLTRCEKFEEALQAARRAMKKAPNNLLANETFYQTAILCKRQGIAVEEPLPTYDLSERFCWSGLNFAWCGGFNAQTGLADFGPCFRPLQCAARPEGEFWSGEDWKEFRKSVTDGSFRYCQKNQCPNIVAGWLPKKSECKEKWLRKILEGGMEVPPLEELHFSYDGHCNLKCPSCRLEIQTNTKEQNENLDMLYEKNLKPYMGRAKHLTLSGCGEAMISPHSKKVLQSFSKEKNPDLAVELRTNATVINPISWNSLGDGRKVIRHITVSIDASEKESFEKLRYPAKWETVTRNLEFIQALRNAGEIDMFEFHVVIQTENIGQLCNIAKMAIHYDADAVTYSRLINWRGMSEDEYYEVNPFWTDHPLHEKLVQELMALEALREDIEKGRCGLTKGRKKIYINIHFSPDPNESYEVIRMGRLKIR